MNCLPRFPGTKRGVFGLDSWTPLLKPGEGRHQVDSVVSHTKTTISSNVSSSLNGQSIIASNFPVKSENEVKSDARKPPSAPTCGQILIAKFNYIANPNSPLGENTELSLCTMDKMTMVKPHHQQEFWWLVRMQDGQQGYVPANYVAIFEEKITALPWLSNKVLEPLSPILTKDQSSYKPYKSAYAAMDTASTSAATKWFCDVCQKSFNGPQPYNAHMSSRAHRDELESQAAY